MIHHIGSSVSYISRLVELGNAALAFSEITNMDADLTNQYIYDGHNPANLKELTEMLHSYGLKCCFYLVDTKEDAIKAINYGVDYMPTEVLWSKNQII